MAGLQLQAGDVHVTVTYEALNRAAADTLANAQRMTDTFDRIRSLNAQMQSYWESDVCDLNEKKVKEILDRVDVILTRFRNHASNLETISQRYVKTSAEVAQQVQGLSTDVIV